jgi:hypothetical protein
MKGSLAEDVKTINIRQQVSGVRIGSIAEITDKGHVFVDFPGNIFGPLTARFAGSMEPKLRKIFTAAGNKVLLVFEDDDPKLPIIIDTICGSLDETSDKDPVALQMDETENVFIDGKRFTFDAKEQIVLRCGKSSITLTRAGKILIRGAYLLNRSSGVNRIKGGSVQIN